jgi:hypothetical protein
MANMLIPVEERRLTPEQVELLDRRRRRGQLLITIGFQTAIVTTLVGVLWVGQDLTHSPGWSHPIFYWACFTGTMSLVSFLWGLSLRRGFSEFTSY